MEDNIVVYVNGRQLLLYRGAQVKHALISYHLPVYEACERGDLTAEDEHGFRVGLEGTLHDGAKIYTRRTK
jgi:hypothetical protein